MDDASGFWPELEEQRRLIDEERCLIEKQQVEIHRLERRVAMLLRHAAQVQAELDAIFKTTAQPTPVTLHSTQRKHSDDKRHGVVRHFRGATVSSSAQQVGTVGDGPNRARGRTSG